MKFYDEFDEYGSEFSEYVAVNVTLFVKAECFLNRSAENDDELLLNEFNKEFKAEMKRQNLNISLSDKLHKELNKTAILAIKNYTKENANTEELAKKLFQGYNFGKDILKFEKKLPKYLFQNAKILSEKNAKKLKTPNLRTAYLEALNAKTAENFEKKLKVAFYEKARFYAKRLALNEATKAYNTAKAKSFLNDKKVKFVQYKMSAKHPRADICDFFANADLYGLGRGIYPKEKAPLTPCHPFCRCNLIPKYSIKGEAITDEKHIKTAENEFFKNLPEYKKAQILGSYEKLRRYKNGENLLNLVNENKKAEYKIKFLENLKQNGVKFKNGKEIDSTTRSPEFRRLQETSDKISNRQLQLFHSGGKTINKRLRERMSGIFHRELERGRVGNNNAIQLLKDTNDFKIYKGIDGDLFYDIFKINQKYIRFGELVTLHEKAFYKDTINYLTDDGLGGFAITKNGDLVSIFNLGKKGFLKAISNEVKSKVKTLDCYTPKKQDLGAIYERIFNFKTASTMDYNMDYDHDDIAKNHNKPKVAFMANTDKKVILKHFDKDSYDEAENYRNSFL